MHTQVNRGGGDSVAVNRATLWEVPEGRKEAQSLVNVEKQVHFEGCDSIAVLGKAQTTTKGSLWKLCFSKKKHKTSITAG